MRLYLLPLLLLLPTLHAAVVPRMAFDQLVADSERIVHAKVLDSQVAPSGQFLWTHYRLQVLDSLRGALPQEITVSEPGGTLNGISMQVSGTTEFRPGDEVVLFLFRTPIGFWRIRGAYQGKFDVANSSTGKRIRAAAGDTGPTVNNLPLADFLSAIRREVSR